MMKRILSMLTAEWLLGLTLMVLILSAALFRWTPLERIELAAYDIRSGLVPHETKTPIAIVTDDDPDALPPPHPWTKARYADLIERLSGAEAEMILLDRVLPWEDHRTAVSEIESIEAEIASIETKHKEAAALKIATLNQLEDAARRLDEDGRLLAEVKKSGRVFAPFSFLLAEPPSPLASGLPGLIQVLREKYSGMAGNETYSATHVVRPFTALASRSAGMGHTHVTIGPDSAARSIPLFIHHDGRYYPALPLRAAARHVGAKWTEVSSLSDITGRGTIRAGGFTLPAAEDLGLLLRYGRNRFPRLTLSEVMTGSFDPADIKGKIVIVEETARRVFSPLGVEITAADAMAAAIDNILLGTALIRPEWALPLETGILLFFGVFIAFVIPRVRAGVGLLISMIFLITWSVAAFYLFYAYGFWLKIAYPAALLLAGHGTLTLKRRLVPDFNRLDAEQIETNKMLGLSFQNQGMLDMAFDKFRQCPVKDASVRDLLYNLGLDFERKRMFGKAVSVYEHMAKGGDFKDVRERIEKLKAADDRIILGGSKKTDRTVIIDSAAARPTLGRYEVVKELGQGAMGTVYLGKDPKINREVAIKTLCYDELEAESVSEVKTRFFREAEAAGKLSHPNIVTIYDVGEDDDIAYMAMELLDGTDLGAHCKGKSRLPLKEAARIAADVAEALDYAHKNGVVHRDIKPANIMLQKSGAVKVTDFGIARVMASSKTQTGIILGTPAYMSPEQISGKKVDGRSDLFSLGIVFYELVTGERPFKGDTFAALMYSIANAAYVPPKELMPKLPDAAAAIIDRMLAKGVTKRYQDGSALATDLRTLAGKK